MTSRLLLMCVAVTAGSCAARSAGPVAAPASHVRAASAALPHENLNAVAWMQTAVEYEATAIQAYRLAHLQLDDALKDPSWSAAIEQTGEVSMLPPAVVLDIDETVLDNSLFQARGVRDNTVYSDESWNRWVIEGGATAVPGAKAFTQYATDKGVAVFFITNRMAQVEEATRANLLAEGFGLPADLDTVLTRGERPEWNTSAKGARRAHVARTYRILLLVGDDLGDFVVDGSGTPADRRVRTAPNADWWGRRWIMIPNPAYGSWERALIGSAKDPIDAKRRALRFGQTR